MRVDANAVERSPEASNRQRREWNLSRSEQTVIIIILVLERRRVRRTSANVMTQSSRPHTDLVTRV